MPPIPADKKQQLKDLISVMDACGAPKEILTARLRKIIAAMDLPKDALAEVRKDFTAAGFKVLNVASGLSAITLLPQQSVINSFETARDQLHAYMQGDKGKLDPQCGIMQKVDDLYDFLAAYKDNDLSAADRYRSSTNLTGIHSEFEMIVKENSGARANSYPYRHYLEMAQAAEKLLNSTDGSAVKYARYCQLDKLKKDYPFLTKLAPIPENIKLEPWFAKECLSKLQLCFNEDEAIAFYNHLSALTETPYEKESTAVTVVCAGCKTVHTYPDLKTAQSASCQCGMPLFRTCPKCDHIWPAVEVYCRECGMNMDAVRNFPMHYQNAESALRASDLIKARAEYDAAKLSNPKETKKLKELDEKITELEKTLGKPISNIQSLIAAKELNAASLAIADMSRKFPGVDMSKYAKQVEGELSWARAEAAKLASLPADKAVEACIRIMQRVADEPTAMAELRKHRPNPVRDLMLRESAENRSCSIGWKPDPQDVGITYTVVRKANSGPPAHINDGEIVARDTISCNTQDTDLKPGVNYYYSVFACRGGMESTAVSNTIPILLLPDLTGFEARGVDGKCMISWKRIEGSQGVRILRDKSIISQCVSAGSFVDEDVDDGDEYTYTLQTVWRVGAATRYSAGIRKDVTIEATPNPVQIRGSIQEGICRITWNKPSVNRNLVVLKLKPNQKVTEKAVYSVSQLRNMGTILKDVSSAAGSYEWSVPENVYLQVAVFLQFGDNVIGSNTISLTNVEGCKIDQNRTFIQNKQLSLQFLSIPEKATRIAYSVSTTGFASYDEAAFLNSVAKESWHTIRGTTSGQDLYVTVFAVYESGGSKIYSAPETCVVPAAGRASIKYEVTWGGLLRNRRSDATLQVTVTGCNQIPAMTLYGSRSGKPIIGNFNKDLVAVGKVPAKTGSNCRIKLDEEALKQLPRKTELRLMMDQECGSRYNLPEALNGTNIVP